MSKYWLIIIIGFFGFSDLQGQVIENYSGNFLHESSKTLNSKSELISTEFDISSFPNSSIKLSVPSNSTVFIANRIWFYATNDTLVIVSLADFKEKFDLMGLKKIPIVIHNYKINQAQITLEKGYFKLDELNNTDFNESNDLVRNRSYFKDFYFVSASILLAFFAIIKIAFPSALSFFLSPKAIFSLGETMEGNPKFFSLDVLFFLLFVGLGVIQCAMFFIYFFGFDSAVYFNSKDLNDLFFKWILGAVIFVFLSIFKFLYLSFMAFIFNLKKFELIHFFFLLRIVSLVVFTIILVQLYVLTNYHIELYQWQIFATKTAFTLYLIGIVFLFVVMTNQLNFKFYHLIAYLCTAELLPFLVFTKYMIW